MKIVSLFAEKLFAFHNEGELLDEYGRLLDLWNDPEYVFDFAEKNKDYIEQLGYSLDDFTENRCKSYLQSKGVFNDDSFFEIIGE